MYVCMYMVCNVGRLCRQMEDGSACGEPSGQGDGPVGTTWAVLYNYSVYSLVFIVLVLGVGFYKLFSVVHST